MGKIWKKKWNFIQDFTFLGMLDGKFFGPNNSITISIDFVPKLGMNPLARSIRAEWMNEREGGKGRVGEN